MLINSSWALSNFAQAAAIAATIPVLVLIIVDDLRHYRIRNEPVLVLVGLFFVYSFAGGSVAMLVSHALFAVAAFAVLLGAYAFRVMGGGDAKLLIVAALWLGPELCLLFSFLLLGCSVAYYAGAKIGAAPSQRINGRTKIPYGPSIAVAWMLALLSSYLELPFSPQAPTP